MERRFEKIRSEIMADREKYLDAIDGSLLGGAIGDALGYPVEFMSIGQIEKRFGPEGITSYEPDFETGQAVISDDTQMTLSTASGILEGDTRMAMRGIAGPISGYVHRAYRDGWLKTQSFAAESYENVSWLMDVPMLWERRAPGGTCLSALKSREMGTMRKPINDSKGCGGVMRVAPCGMLKIPKDDSGEDAYALQGAMAAAITHSHTMGYVPAAMLADIVHLIMVKREMGLEEIIRDSLARVMRLFAKDCGSGQMQAFTEMIEKAIDLAKTDLPAVEAIGQIGEGWVGDEALAIAVYCVLKYEDNMEDCLSAAVTHRGDSDSTGAVAGNILGAWLGVEGIPAAWLETVELREVIEETARLLYAAQMN